MSRDARNNYAVFWNGRYQCEVRGYNDALKVRHDTAHSFARACTSVAISPSIFWTLPPALNVRHARSTATRQSLRRSAMPASDVLQGLNCNADKCISRAYRTVNLKTVSISLCEQLARDLAEIDGTRCLLRPS